MRAKEIVLLILIVAGGILFYHAQTGKIFIDWEWDGGIFIGHEEFVYEETEDIAPPFPSRLLVTNAHGSVDIQGTDQENITVTLEKRILRRNQRQADKAARQLEMMIHKESGVLRVSSNREDFRRHNFRTHFTISLPEHLAVEVENSFGLVKIAHVGEIKINNPHGRILVLDIRGPVSIKNSYRDVEVEAVRSDCAVESKNASVNLKDVGGLTQVTHRYGTIHLEDIADKATVEGSNSEVFGQNIHGLLDIQTSYRKVTLFDVAAAKIRTNNSSVEIDGAKDFVDIEDNYGSVNLSRIQGDLTVEGKNLEVYGKSIVGDKIYISSSYGGVELLKFQGRTEIIHSHGDVSLEPLPLTHSIDVQGKYTDIAFYWPSGERYPIEARSKGGEIDWDIHEELTRQEENGTTVIKAFTEERDKPSIILSTTYGTIRMEKF